MAAIVSSFTQPYLLTTVVLLLVVHCARTHPSVGSEEYSAEDISRSLEQQSDKSSSALKTDDSLGVEESAIETSELSPEGSWVDEDDDLKKIESSLPENESPKKNSFSLLKKVYSNADEFPQKLDQAAKLANSKITDWSQRINTYRNLIFGPGNNNNNNNNYGGGGGYGNDGFDNFGQGGGGYYGQNNNNFGGPVSIMTTYKNIIRPFFHEFYDMLSKVFKVLSSTTKFASQLLVGISTNRERSTQNMSLGNAGPYPGPYPGPVGGKMKTAKKRGKARRKYKNRTKSQRAGRKRSKTTEREMPETQASPVTVHALLRDLEEDYSDRRDPVYNSRQRDEDSDRRDPVYNSRQREDPDQRDPVYYRQREAIPQYS